MATLLLSAGVGLLIAMLYAASPLTIWVLAATPLLFLLARRGLPAEERRALTLLLGAALVTRVLLVGAMFIAGLPNLNDLSIGALAGDESYNLARALRSRDIVLGFATSKYDYFVATDEYGRTLYVNLLGWLQVIFGPTPYGMRLVNTMLFLTGATLLYRLVRRGFGPVPALAGLAVVLFVPSLLVSSVSLLKESFYFFATSVALVASVKAARARNAWEIAGSIVVIVVCVWSLNDLRRSAALLTLAGIGLGFAIHLVLGYRWRMAAAAALLVVAGVVTAAQPALRQRALDAVVVVAKIHAGHVFTVGHAYKLMDEGFYINPGIGPVWDISLTEPQALRFLIRAGVSFVVTPLPWEMASRAELAFLPEHALWLVQLALVPIGVAAAWRRDRLVTSILIGYVIPIAAAVALTNGNVGTLLRLRGLVSPYLAWLSALGLLVVAEAILSRRSHAPGPHSPKLASERHLA
ncbi:MAG: hypothetical protein ACRD2N_15615 [Vicinamibacterales bacterium]